MKHWMIATLACIGLPACSSNGSVDLGQDNPEILGERLTDYAGRWSGYAEAYDFSPGSDRIELRLSEDGTGVVVFGEGVAPPPATNPDIGYPEGEAIAHPGMFVMGNEFRGGVAYPLHGVLVEDRRIRFSVSSYDLWDGWCRLQAPVLVLDTGSTVPSYGIFPYSSGLGTEGKCFLSDPISEETTEVDCGKLYLAQAQICSCSATACQANSNPTAFDAALQSQGEELVGTLAMAGRVTVRLARE